jgi:hypothetical protein
METRRTVGTNDRPEGGVRFGRKGATCASLAASQRWIPIQLALTHTVELYELVGD